MGKNKALDMLVKDFDSIIEELEKDNFKVEVYASSTQGYGFYVEKPDNKKYVEVIIFDMFTQVDISVKVMQHNSKFGHDLINDIEMETYSYYDVESNLSDVINQIKERIVEQLNLDFDYCVEISAINEEGEYIENSDIFLPVFKTKQEAVELANKIDFQDKDKYQLYIYEINAETKEIYNSWRIK